ncbi:hypothetical protein SAMN05216189_10321, partial [Pseudomonas delhiensis]
IAWVLLRSEQTYQRKPNACQEIEMSH